jgi:hypothetical protein
LTPTDSSANCGRMGRKLLFPEKVDAKFVAGTKARIAACFNANLREFSEFVRIAVEAELQTRETERRRVDAENARIEALRIKADTPPEHG